MANRAKNDKHYGICVCMCVFEYVGEQKTIAKVISLDCNLNIIDGTDVHWPTTIHYFLRRRKWKKKQNIYQTQ